MNIDIDDQEQEDLKQLLYEKIKTLDDDPKSSIENSREGNLANRLNAFYERLNTEQKTLTLGYNFPKTPNPYIMQTEINNENRQKFYSLYYLQAVFINPLMGELTYYYNGANIDETEDNDGCYLLLTHLSDITSADFTEICFKRYGFQPHKPKEKLVAEHLNQIQTDYLRSKGYALPWMGLSVQGMVDAGWILLKGGEDGNV